MPPPIREVKGGGIIIIISPYFFLRKNNYELNKFFSMYHNREWAGLADSDS